MNRFLLLGLGAALLGCDDRPSEVTAPGSVLPANVLWMEWPASVTVDQPYQVRLIIPALCSDGHLEMQQVQTEHVVMFDARWADVHPSELGCDPAGPFHAFLAVEGIRIAGSPRSLELQATGSTLDSRHRFGILTLVPDATADSTLAAGITRFFSETAGCDRMQPAGRPAGGPPGPPSYQLKGQAPDTSSSRLYWVEGYLEKAKTACSQGAADTLVFHLITYSASPD